MLKASPKTSIASWCITDSLILRGEDSDYNEPPKNCQYEMPYLITKMRGALFYKHPWIVISLLDEVLYYVSIPAGALIKDSFAAQLNE